MKILKNTLRKANLNESAVNLSATPAPNFYYVAKEMEILIEKDDYTEGATGKTTSTNGWFEDFKFRNLAEFHKAFINEAYPEINSLVNVNFQWDENNDAVAVQYMGDENGNMLSPQEEEAWKRGAGDAYIIDVYFRITKVTEDVEEEMKAMFNN